MPAECPNLGHAGAAKRRYNPINNCRSQFERGSTRAAFFCFLYDMAQIQSDVLKRSVTRDEAELSMSHYWIAPLAFGGDAGLVNMPSDPPAYWSSARDIALRDAYRRGGQWASAINIAVTRVMSAGYELDGDVGLRVRRGREVLGSSWIDAVQRLAMDYVTTDNGGFWEIVRATKAYGSRVLGIVPLSSLRCIRTGDPETPVLYVDRLGKYHEMRAHQVVAFSDMPDEDYFGVGLSATSRAWDTIYTDMAVSAYFREKATGRRPLALHFMSGMGDNAIEQTLKTAQEDASRRGLTSFMGAAIKGNPNNVPLSLVTVPLASLPDHFNQQQHDEQRDIKFAAALGIDPSDLNPRLIGNRQLGAGAQAQILDDKQDSKGLIGLRQKIAAFFNDTETWHPLPGGVTFAWSERDLKDQQAKAGIAQVRAATRASQITSGEITADEARQLAVDAGDIPQSFIPVDKTDEETLTDEDKADSGQLPEATPEAQPESPASDAFPKADPLQTGAGAPATALKAHAAGATMLAKVVPSPAGEPSDRKAAISYWRKATTALDELGAAWRDAARSLAPSKEGVLRESIDYEISRRNTPLVSLKLYAGNRERPEVAIRAVLYGRRGFGPKRAKALRFVQGGKTVFARKVRGALANDWLTKSMKAIAPQMREAEKQLASLNVNAIDVSDVSGAIKRTRLSQIKAPATKRKRK